MVGVVPFGSMFLAGLLMDHKVINRKILFFDNHATISIFFRGPQLHSWDSSIGFSLNNAFPNKMMLGWSQLHGWDIFMYQC